MPLGVNMPDGLYYPFSLLCNQTQKQLGEAQDSYAEQAAHSAALLLDALVTPA